MNDNNTLIKKDGKKNWKYKMLDFVRTKVLCIVPDKLYLKIMYKLKTGHKLNLKEPKRYTEKIQWLKLYGKKPEYTNYADKIKVREIVKNKCGNKYLIPLLGVYNSFEDIDFDKLPEQFVLKCNHDSGSVVICTDKNNFNFEYAKKKLNKALKTDYAVIGREYIYKDIDRKIMAEEYLSDLSGDSANDYKIFIMNGELSHIEICSDRFTDFKVTYFDKYKNKLNISEMGEKVDKSISLPTEIDEMIRIAKEIAKGIPLLRVDFYDVNGKIYFGEVAFFDCSGYATYSDDSFDYKLGENLILPEGKN